MASLSGESSGQKQCLGNAMMRSSNSMASRGETAAGVKFGFDEIRTKPVWVNGQVAKPCRLRAANHD